jgi:hypothetical protein
VTPVLAYAKEMKPSEWIKAQPAFLGAQDKTVFDPDFDIDDSGLPRLFSTFAFNARGQCEM